jgi:hypothetical protein
MQRNEGKHKKQLHTKARNNNWNCNAIKNSALHHCIYVMLPIPPTCHTQNRNKARLWLRALEKQDFANSAIESEAHARRGIVHKGLFNLEQTSCEAW